MEPYMGKAIYVISTREATSWDTRLHLELPYAVTDMDRSYTPISS
jgi:hypothetical protein